MTELLRVSFLVSSSDAEIARAWLVEHVPAGFEERVVGAATELIVYTDAAGEAEIRASFAEVSTESVATGWEDRWKEFHRPISAARIWIGPPWALRPAAGPAIVIDPGRAFGTGAHATTRACIELLAGIERGSLLDAGCGSGVVAIAAAKLGFAPVRAVDVDVVAVDVASRAARENGVDVDVRRADVLVDRLAPADVLVANIELTVVERLLARFTAGVAVTSGYLASERPEVVGWEPSRRLELDGWAADVHVAK